MSNTEITPELIRMVVNHPAAPAEALIPLAQWADRMERQQADEKRIDELARISFDAEHAYASAERPSSTLIGWDGSSEFQRNIARAGIRAVLDKLRIDSYTSACDGKCGDSSPHNGHLTTEGRRHFLGEPRTWNDLRDVPAAVQTVRDVDGHAVHRVGATGLGWRWQVSECAPMEEAATVYAPFTEVIADA